MRQVLINPINKRYHICKNHVHFSCQQLHMRRWREIDFLAKQIAIRFGCVTLVVSWFCCVTLVVSWFCCVTLVVSWCWNVILNITNKYLKATFTHIYI